MRTMPAKYAGICPSCGGQILPGQSIDYAPGIRARHTVCPGKLHELRVQAFEASELAHPGYRDVNEDHPRVRRHAKCPVCGRGKDAGLLVCWPCYRKHEFRYGPEARIENLIDEAELYLAGDAYGRPENFRK